MVFASFDDALAEVVYWSAPLPESENLEALAASTRQWPTGGTLDAVAGLSICPEPMQGFMGQPGIEGATHAFAFSNDTAEGNSLDLVFESDGTFLSLHVEAFPDSDVITLSQALSGREAGRSICAPALPAPAHSDHMIEFSGRWCGEFQRELVLWQVGARRRASREGRTSHTDFPGLIVPCRGCTETQGEAYGYHLAWSGGHEMLAEELPDGRRQVQFTTSGARADLVVSYSGEGLSGLSHNFHRHVRNHILDFPDPDRPRPVHYNCWEAVYFDHKPAVLIDLADRAAALGVERFVLDDGWFGKRDDDTTSLGDWVVDKRKWPDGLTPLIDHVKSLGMEFGLWVEPEMFNIDSDLARAHPDWFATSPVAGRGQHVLDLSQPHVSDYLFDQISALFAEYDIGYLKWDHNRALTGTGLTDQAPYLYALFERIREAHPQVEIETCASGGGRVDMGILRHTHRFWASDSNDAKARWDIQRGASFFFPPEITGAHVGPETCHTSGRRFPISYRAGVAGTRAMGLEMDLRELDDSENDLLKSAIARFKSRREILHSGRLVRLDSADPAVSAEMHLLDDKFVLFAAQLEPSARQLARPLRLARLDPDTMYRVQLENPEDIPDVMNRGYRNPLANGVTLSGAALMGRGLTVPQAFPDTLWTVTGKKVAS